MKNFKTLFLVLFTGITFGTTSFAMQNSQMITIAQAIENATTMINQSNTTNRSTVSVVISIKHNLNRSAKNNKINKIESIKIIKAGMDKFGFRDHKPVAENTESGKNSTQETPTLSTDSTNINSNVNLNSYNNVDLSSKDVINSNGNVNSYNNTDLSSNYVNDNDLQSAINQINAVIYSNSQDYGTVFNLSETIQNTMPNLVQLESNQQYDGTTCGYHVAANVRAINDLVNRNQALTSNGIKAGAQPYLQNMSNEQLFNEQIFELEAIRNLDNVYFVGFGHNGQITNLDARRPLDNIFDQINDVHNNCIHFIINNGGHWVMLSIVKRPGREPIALHLNSTNAELIADSFSYILVKHCYDLVEQNLLNFPFNDDAPLEQAVEVNSNTSNPATTNFERMNSTISFDSQISNIDRACQAARDGDVDTIKELLANTEFNCKEKDSTGKTPWHYALENGHNAILNLVKQHVFATEYSDGTCPICCDDENIIPDFYSLDCMHSVCKTCKHHQIGGSEYNPTYALGNGNCHICRIPMGVTECSTTTQANRNSNSDNTNFRSRINNLSSHSVQSHIGQNEDPELAHALALSRQAADYNEAETLNQALELSRQAADYDEDETLNQALELSLQMQAIHNNDDQIDQNIILPEAQENDYNRAFRAVESGDCTTIIDIIETTNFNLRTKQNGHTIFWYANNNLEQYPENQSLQDIVQFIKKKIYENTRRTIEEQNIAHVCPVCLEDEFEENELNVASSDCLHFICTDCKQGMIDNAPYYQQPVCPECRNQFD